MYYLFIYFLPQRWPKNQIWPFSKKICPLKFSGTVPMHQRPETAFKRNNGWPNFSEAAGGLGCAMTPPHNPNKILETADDILIDSDVIQLSAQP